MRWLKGAKKNFKDKPDESLVEEFRTGDDQHALNELYERYIHLVYGVCLKYLHDREEAKDATMQLFERLMTTLKEHDIHSFRSWLYATTKNHCLMILRRHDRDKKVGLENMNFMESAEELHPLDSDEDQLEALLKCMEVLKKQQRECIQLFYLKKNNYEQIVATTGYDIKKVKSYLQNGRRNLKICIENNGKKA